MPLDRVPGQPFGARLWQPAYSQDSRSGLELVSPETRTRGSGVIPGATTEIASSRGFGFLVARRTTPLRWKGASYGHAPTPYPSLYADRDPHLAITGAGAAAGGPRQPERSE